MRRTFNRRERFALYLAADGKCEICGAPLDQSFHADHITPYSKGGETSISNGQALCPECNLKKGDSQGANVINFRLWQDEQFEKFTQEFKRWFMVVATPGAGKSIAMARSADHSIRSGETDNLLIVTPSDNLKTQWKGVMKLFGYNMIRDFNGYFSDKDFHGVIVSYQQMARSPEVVASFFRHRRVFVILDEPHHMGDQLSWGANAQHALKNAVRGIMGSGTPFRSDNHFIPFVQYDNNGRLQIDYQYSYGDALADQVVRGVFFRKVNADAEWISYNDEIVTGNFDAELTKRQAQELLNISLQPDGDWMQTTLRQAANDIAYIRRHEQPDAGLLIVCRDTNHATAVQREFSRISGYEPIVVSSHNEHENADAITAFADSDDPCIIAVDMISEGVDIPRLRSLVYATNKTTRLYFEQIIGRIVRVQKGRELDNGLCYLPSHRDLLRYADEFKRTRDYIVEIMRFDRERESDEYQEREQEARQMRMYEVIQLEGRLDGGIYGDETFTEDDLIAAREWKKLKGYRIPDEEAVKIYRNEVMVALHSKPAQTAVKQDDPETRRKDLSKTCNSMAYRIAMRDGVKPQDIHSEWVYQHGGNWQTKADIDELERKMKWLREKLNS